MEIFTVNLDRDWFIARGEVASRQREETEFHLFTKTRADAEKLAKKYIGDKIGHSSNIKQHATFDPIEQWLTPAKTNEYLSAVERVIAEVSNFVGTITIENIAIISPANESDSIILSLHEGSRQRTLIETICNNEDGTIEWRDDMVTFNVLSLAKEIQKLF